MTEKSILDSDLSSEDIDEIEREKAEEQDYEIQRKYATGEIPQYENGNGKSNPSTRNKGQGKEKESEEEKTKKTRKFIDSVKGLLDGKEKEENDDEKKAYVICKYSQGIPLAEGILIKNIPHFIQIENTEVGAKIEGKSILSEKIPLSDIDLLPPERTEYLSKEYAFESIDEVNYFIELAKKQTFDSLYQLIKSIWTKYVDIDEDFIVLCAADTIFSHFQDKMGMCHYLLIVGDNNTGKSNILLVFSYLGYRALYDTSITPANIYNFCGQLEEAQGMIIEDEIDDIDDNIEKKKLYKVGYKSGTKVTRMYDNNNSGNNNNNKRKISRQQAFLLYLFKVFASEKMPDKIKSKGFLERVIPLKSVSGDPQFDISEVVNDAGDEQLKELHKELLNTRKLLLMYRLLHYNDSFPNIELNIKNRYKQLTKPLIRLFQNTESVNEIINALSKYLIEKNEEKINSLDSALLFLIIDLVSSKENSILYNEEIWQKVKTKYPGNEIEGKSYSYFSEEFATTISKTKIRNICENKFGAKEHRDPIKGRGLIFNQDKLNKLSANYSIINGIKIVNPQEKGEETTKRIYDTCDTCDTSTYNLKINDNKLLMENYNSMTDLPLDNEGLNPKNDIIPTETCINIDPKNNGHSHKVSQVSQVSYNKFNNPLISDSDLKDPNGYQYDPEIIYNIDRYENSDQWYCKKKDCKIRGDKWLLMRHNCNYKNNNDKKEEYYS